MSSLTEKPNDLSFSAIASLTNCDLEIRPLAPSSSVSRAASIGQVISVWFFPLTFAIRPQYYTRPRANNFFVDGCITENYSILNMKRGLVSKSKAQPVAVWLPDALKAQLDAAVERTDTDRSKLIRSALREKLASLKLTSTAA